MPGSAGGPPAPFGDSPDGIPNGLNDWPGGSPGHAGQRPALPHRFFRAVMLERLSDGLGLSLQGVGPGGTRPYHACLTLTNALPAHTLVFQASEDLRHWTPLATNTPVVTNNWQFLDTNAPAFNKRFYRAVGQGK